MELYYDCDHVHMDLNLLQINPNIEPLSWRNILLNHLFECSSPALSFNTMGMIIIFNKGTLL